MNKQSKKSQAQSGQETISSAEVTYTIKRVGSGYAVFNSIGTKISEENMWPFAIKALETILRKELGL